MSVKTLRQRSLEAVGTGGQGPKWAVEPVGGGGGISRIGTALRIIFVPNCLLVLAVFCY
jgi:hypothetical protein